MRHVPETTCLPPLRSCELLSPILSQPESSTPISCTGSWAFTRIKPLVWSLPIPNNESRPVLHWCSWCHGGKSLQICHLGHIPPQGAAFQTRQNCPEKESPALPAVSLVCLMCSWLVVYGEGEELGSGWANKGGELASTQSMVDRSVTASRMSNGAKGAGEPQSGNSFSPCSTALSRPLLCLLSCHHLQRTVSHIHHYHSKASCINAVFHAIWYYLLIFP